jgi:hypothetical protein
MVAALSDCGDLGDEITSKSHSLQCLASGYSWGQTITPGGKIFIFKQTQFTETYEEFN